MNEVFNQRFQTKNKASPLKKRLEIKPTHVGV